MKAIAVLMFLIGCFVGATATLSIMHSAIKRQVRLQTEVLAQAAQARALNTECKAALEGIWVRIEAGRAEHARRMED